ncbi:periaxin isoform X2 [Rhinatrema bivittatum]|nr:periaxin isoform X2 [Rhinatrema bivittatum]
MPVKKKKVKSPADVSGEGTFEDGGNLDVEISPGMMEIPPVDVEFALPRFPGLMKAKGEVGAGVTMKGPDALEDRSPTEKKHRKLKLPRLRVKEAAAVKSLNVGIQEPSSQIDVAPPRSNMEMQVSEGKAKVKTPKFGILFPRTKKPKVDVMLAKKEVEISVPEAGIEIQKDINFKPPEVELDMSLIPGKSEVTVLKPKIDGRSVDFKAEVEATDDFNQGEGLLVKLPKFGLSPKKLDIKVKGGLPVAQGDVEVGGLEGKLKMPQIPKVDISLPRVEGESRSGIDFGLEAEGFEGLSKPGIQLPSVDIDIPKIDVDISLPKVEGDAEMIGSIETPDTSLKEESFKVKMPTFGVSAQMPDVDLHVPRPQALGDVKVEGPEVELKMPKMKAPKFGISLSKDKTEGDMDVSLVQPKVHADNLDEKYKPGFKMPSLNIAVPTVDLDITVPKGQMEVTGEVSKDIVGHPTEASIEIPDVTMKMPKIKLPKFGARGKEGDVDSHLLPPNVEGEMKVPQAKVKVGKIESPDIKAKGRKIKLPTFGISLTKDKHDVAIPKVDIKAEESEISTKGQLQFPEVKMPSIDISTPKLPDVQLPQAKLEISGPAVARDIKAPEMEGVEGSDYKLKIPKVDFLVKADKPDLDIQVSPPKIGLPKLEMEIGERDLELKGGKMSVPKLDLSLPEMKPIEPYISPPKAELEISVGKPKVDLRVPRVEANVKGPKMEIDSSETKLSFPSVKLPSLDVDLSKVDVDLNLPKPKAEVLASHLEETDVKLKMPKIPLSKFSGKDMDVEIDVPTPKLMVDVKMPHIEADLKGADVEFPHLTDKGLKISIPKPIISVGKKELTGKEMETEQKLKAKINSMIPQVEIEAPDMASSLEAKLKLPTVEVPSVKMSAPKVPDVDIDAHIPIVSAELMGKADTNLGFAGDAEAKGKMAKFSFPKFGISGSKTKKGDVEVEADSTDAVTKESKLKMPKFGISLTKNKHEADIGGVAAISKPALELEVKAPKGKIEVARPHIEIDSSKAKVRLPVVQIPKVDISAPKVDVDINLPEGKLDVSDEGNTDLPRAVIDRPSEINIEVPDVKLKMPKFSFPRFGTKGKEHELGIDLEGSRASAKRGDSLEIVSGGLDISLTDSKTKDKEVKMKMPKFKIPSFGISKKDVDVSKPRVEAGIAIPTIDVTVKKDRAEVMEAEMSAESPDGKLKTPFIKMPKFKMPSPKGKASEGEVKMDTGVDIQGPDVQIKMPTIAFPKFGMKDAIIDSGTDISLPNAKVGLVGGLETSQGTRKTGKVEIPALEVSAPHTMPSLQISVPGVQIGSEVSVPKPVVDISATEFKGPQGDLRIPHMPSIDISSPKVELDISLPKTKADTAVELGAGDEIGLSKSETKLKMPKVELPKFGTLEDKDQDANVEVNGKKIKAPAINVTGQKVMLDIKGPLYGTEDTEETLKGAKIRMPKLDISLPKVRTSDSDLPFAEREIGMEGHGFREEEMESKFALPSVELPKISTPKLRAPDVELDISLGTERDYSLGSNSGRSDVQMKTHQVETHGPDIEDSSFKLKMHKIKMPKFGGPSAEVKGMEGDVDLGLSKIGIMNIMPSKVEGRFEAPSAEGGIKGVKIKIPRLQIGSSKEKTEEDILLGTEGEAVTATTDMKPQEVEAHGDSRKFKIKMPTFGISRSSVDTKEVEAGTRPSHLVTDEAEFRLKLPHISIPDVGFSAGEGGEGEVALDRGQAKAGYSVDAKFKGPKVELEQSASTEDLGVGLGVLDTKLKMPRIKMPAIEISGWKDKTDDDMTVALEGKKEFQMEDPEGNTPQFKMPGIEIAAPKIKMQAEYAADGTKFESGVSGDAEIAVSGKVKMTDKAHQKGDFSGDEVGKISKVKLPKFEIDLPEVDLDISSPKLNVETKDAQMKAEHELKSQEGKVKVPKVKKAVFVLAKPKKKEADTSFGLLKSDVDAAAGSMEGKVHTSEVKLKMPKIKMKPSFGISRSKPKGTQVNGEFDVSLREEGNAELSLEDKGKLSKLKFPKLGFATSKPESLDINVNGTGPSSSSAQINGEHNLSLQDNKVKLGKLKFPNVEFSSPYKTKEVDTEMSQNLVKTEEPASKDETFGSTFTAVKAPKFKSPKISFSGFKKKVEKGEELDASGNLVTSPARTEMATLEKGGDGESKAGIAKISLGFITSKSKGEYIVDNSEISLASGTSKEATSAKAVDPSEAESKDKSAKFKLPKFSLSPKSRGVLEIRSQEQEKRGYFQEMEEEGPSGGFKISMPQVGFTAEEQIIEQKGGSSTRMYKTKKLNSETVNEKSTSI